MFFVRRTYSFQAAHQLPNHDGKCRRLHGHSFEVTIELKGESLVTEPEHPKFGMLTDFDDIDKLMKPLIEEKFEHHFLNETLPILPTSEHLAFYFYNFLRDKLPHLSAVFVRENTARSEVEYRP